MFYNQEDEQDNTSLRSISSTKNSQGKYRCYSTDSSRCGRRLYSTVPPHSCSKFKLKSLPITNNYIIITGKEATDF